MATISNLAVKLTANTAEFKSKLSGAQKAMAGFGKIAGVVSSLGVGAMIKNAVDAGDRVQKLAIQTGLSTETLSGLGHAAELSGSNMEALAKGMKRLQRSAVEAADGTALYEDAFKELNLNAAEFLTLSPDEQLRAWAEAISKVEDPARRTALSMDLLGRSGGDLIPLFENGAAGLDKFQQAAERLNKVINRDQADKMAAFNDSMTNLQGAFGGIANVLAVELVPGITEFIDLVTGKLPEVIQISKDAFGAVGNLLGGAAAFNGAVIDGNFRGAFEVAKGTFTDIGSDISSAVDGISNLFSDDDDTGQEQVSEQKTTNQQIKETNRILKGGIAAVAQ